MRRAIFDFVKARGRAEIPDPPTARTRRGKLQVTAFIGEVTFGRGRSARGRTWDQNPSVLGFGVMNISADRTAASMIGGRHA